MRKSKNYYLTDTEFEVMEKIWQFEDGIRQCSLLELFLQEGKEWKRQTLNTFLSRLEEKGLVERKDHIVRPLCSKEELGHCQTQRIIDSLYDGKLSNLVLAFSEAGDLSDKEAERLLEMIRQKKK